MTYEDEHRIFLQGIMCKGILSSQEVLALFKLASGRCGITVSEDSKEHLVGFMKCINEELKDLNFEIVKVFDEDVVQKKTFYAFVSRMDRSNDTSQLTRKGMVRYGPHELEYLKLIIEAIVDNEDREIGNIEAINLAKNVKTKMVRNQEGELIISKFVDDLWLKKVGEGCIRLTPRFLAEMEPYLKEVHGDDIKTCQLCKKMVMRGLSCQFCPPGTIIYHRYCLAAKKGRREDTSAPCQMCQKKIEFAESTGKRKRRIVESDSD